MYYFVQCLQSIRKCSFPNANGSNALFETHSIEFENSRHSEALDNENEIKRWGGGIWEARVADHVKEFKSKNRETYIHIYSHNRYVAARLKLQRASDFCGGEFWRFGYQCEKSISRSQSEFPLSSDIFVRPDFVWWRRASVWHRCIRIPSNSGKTSWVCVSRQAN